MKYSSIASNGLPVLPYFITNLDAIALDKTNLRKSFLLAKANPARVFYSGIYFFIAPTIRNSGGYILPSWP